jgi:hypothetical protein
VSAELQEAEKYFISLNNYASGKPILDWIERSLSLKDYP